jgi:nitrate/nitrite transport system permease protein
MTKNNFFPPFVAFLLFLLLWQIGFSHKGASLPTPFIVWREAKELILKPFYVDGADIGLGLRVLFSLKRVALGFSFAAFFGVLIGVIIGQSQLAMRALDPLFQIFRTVPPLAWLPLSLAGFKDSNPSAIFVIFITAIWPILINTATGVQQTPKDYINVARVLRLNPFEYFFKITLPACSPYIFTGLRIGIGLAWLAIVAAEMLTGGVGIGFFIWDAWNSSKLSDLIVALFYIGLTGFLLDKLVVYVGSKVA